jgi:hypothetical protein
VEKDAQGVLSITTASNRLVWDELAKIMRNRIKDIWVVSKTGPHEMKDHVVHQIPEMLSREETRALAEAVESGDLFVRTSPV